MNKKTAHILWFDQISKNDIPLVGGKGANLGEMYTADIPVPNGFVVTAKAYFDFVEKTSLKKKILQELSGLDVNRSKDLMAASEKIKTAILAAEMPSSLKDEIKKAYHKLSGENDRYVAVRSSATAEDLPDASFAGQQETYLNIKGFEEVVKNVQKCWASLFESRAIFYRTDKGFNHMKVGIAVPVQLMVQSDVSGIMFTVNPLTNNRAEISIEAAYGLGQPVVSGELNPDQYIVTKNKFDITYKYIAKQTWQLSLGGNAPVSAAFQEEQKMTDAKVKELAKIGAHVEEHYKMPMDMEWGMEGKKLYIVQARPVTTLKFQDNTDDLKIDESKHPKLLLEGLGASPGVASGKVIIVKNPSEIDKVLQGDILVAEMTNPDYVPAMRRAAAILTDKGGRTSHAAIVSRELGIPAVVGSLKATQMLTNGEVITVDGIDGKVYEGDVTAVNDKKETIVSLAELELKTHTKIYMNLAEPELAPEMAMRRVDGVGLLRAEFMIANIGTHPRKFIEDGKSADFTKQLAEGLEKFAKAFNPRPVVYRTTDFRSNEYKNLKGGAKYEQEEFNPMIGFRGVGRYIDDAEVFKLELDAILHVRNKLGYKNLYVMLPFVRTIQQLREVKKLMSAHGLRRSGNFKLWMMAEIPSNVLMINEFIDEGIDGVSIGTNDLTMLTLGVDRDNEKVAPIYNEMDPAVLKALEMLVTTCRKRGITCSICGQAPSVYPELVKMLVEWGITSVSISPDVVEKTRRIVYEQEQKALKEHKPKKRK